MTIATAWTSYFSDSEVRVGVVLDGETSVAGVLHASGGDYNATVSVAASGWALLTFTGLPAAATGTIDITTPSDSTTVTYRTLDPTPSTFSVATGSCMRLNTNHPIFATIAADGHDFIIHQGDFHYADATEESEWRTDWVTNASEPNVRAMMASAPMTYRYDNHDWGGNDSWRESPCGAWLPGVYRELAGPQVSDVAIYRTYAHKGVRFVEMDCWSERDDHFSTDSPTKYMLSPEQEQWFYDTMASATEPLIILASHFPLYGTWVANARWGDYQYQGNRIWNFFRSHLDVAARTIAVAGDSHNVCADDGANTMWGLPSLNASPFDRTGDPGGSAGGIWDIINNDRIGPEGYYSRLDFDYDTDPDSVIFTWNAIEIQGDGTNAGSVATYTKTFSRNPDISNINSPFQVRVDGQLYPVSSLAYGQGGLWRKVTSMQYLGQEIAVPPFGMTLPFTVPAQVGG